MNNELFKERNELEKKLYELNRFMELTDTFLKKKTQYYTYPESLVALKAIKAIVNQKDEEYNRLYSRYQIVKKSLVDSCHHEIIFQDELNAFCAICRTLITRTPDTTQLEITIPGGWEDPEIKADNEFGGKHLREIIYETGEEFGLSEDLQACEETLEKLQFNSNIKIRRLK